MADCAFCKTPATLLCSSCRSVYYCNPVCQRNDWKIHKKQCCFKRKKSIQENIIQDNKSNINIANSSESYPKSNDNEDEEEHNIEDTCSDIDNIVSDECNFEPHIPFKYKYLSPLISLKTTDEPIQSKMLLDYDTNQSDIPNLKSIHVHSNRKILAQIQNILSQQECKHIINHCETLQSFQDLNKSNKYDQTVRKSSRLLILDEQLSSLLWYRLHAIIQNDIIKSHNISTTPLGFGVLNETINNWAISSINIAMRINKYSSNNKDFFTFHKDAQYAPSADERSLFTLIIYLNDDFEGGTTNFYFNKTEHENSLIQSDYTITEEINHFGGIDEGFEIKTIKPCAGSGIIFSQDIIHEGCIIKTPDKYKYILKTDIVVKRDTVIGFAISSQESKDYQRCLNYFTEAQSNELKGKKQKANKLYERSLFIRYSYPQKLLTNKTANVTLKLAMNIDAIWLIIFDYCHMREMECVTYLFPRELYQVFAAWKLIYDKNTNITDHDLSLARDMTLPLIMDEPYIPTLISRQGCCQTFEFDNYDFFMENEENCCRVAAIYAFCLMSNAADAEYFIAEYNIVTQNVIAVPFVKLLRDVFYNRECNGAYFKLKQEYDVCGNYQAEEITTCFNKNIDRDYMNVVHGSQFVGGVGLLSDMKYGCHVSATVTPYDEINYNLDDQSEIVKRNIKEKIAVKGFLNTDYKNKDLYLSDLSKMKKVGHYKTELLQQKKYEEADYDACESDHEVDLPMFFDEKYYKEFNYQIFDFSKFKLNVYENRQMFSKRQCGKCLSLVETFINQHVSGSPTLNMNDLKYYIVDIESLFKNGNCSLSFNHASCTCQWHEVDINAEIDSNLYVGYSHVNHVHITAIKSKENKVKMWVSYNGISAM